MRAARLALILFWALLASACSSTTYYADGSQAPSSQKEVATYTELGVEYLRAGDTAAAKVPLQHALKIDPGYAPAYNILALVFQRENENELARQYFQKAISADSDSAMIHNNFGTFLFAQKEYEQACRELERATEDPFYQLRAQAFENLGRCYRKLGHKEAAVHAYERALHLSTQYPAAMVELADLYLDENKPAKASQLFDQYRKLVNDNKAEHSAKSLWVGIRVARYQGNSTLAVTYALLLKNMYPDSAEYKLYKESEQ